MTDKPKLELNDDELIHEMERLEKAVRLSVVPTPMFIVRGFLMGMFSTIGALITAAIVIPILLYVFRDLPLIGRFVDMISRYLDGGA